MRRSIVTLAAGVGLLVLPALAAAEVTYSFILEADQVVPPSGSIAAGHGAATLNI